jgi:hypothetical protein
VQEAKFYETYYFCNIIRNVLYDQFSYIRSLNEFYGDDTHFYLLKPFEKYSTFHQFIEFIVDGIYYENASHEDLEAMQNIYKNYSRIPAALEDIKPHKLEIELALKFHQIEHESFESYLADSGKNFATCDEDDVHDYMSEVRNSGAYEKLIDQTVKEVFHILFQNRPLMLFFNEMISSAIEIRADDPIPDGLEYLFKRPGILERKSIPKWVQRAVVYRDRGRCVLCDKDLSGMLNFENVENYDHVVPLARHGLNDVSNIQLLCHECNQEKRAGRGRTSSRYQSWYAYNET